MMKKLPFLILACALPAMGLAGEACRPVSDQEAIDRCHTMFYNSRNTWKTNKWLGILTQQNPSDVWVTQEIITETAPDYIVETGTLNGGSALIWAMVLEQVNPEGRVVTIDIKKPPQSTLDRKLFKERITFIEGSSTDPAIVARIADMAKGKKVMVILDSDHSTEHVTAEMNAYAPMIQVGGYLIVQDTNVGGNPVWPEYGTGPMGAVEKFLKENDAFRTDESRERWLVTFHPRGYLQRVK
jgi:cephalosporin hydroxylase